MDALVALSVIARVYNFQPLLTRAEVFKVGVTHYFAPDKPKRDIGYACTAGRFVWSLTPLPSFPHARYQPLVSMKEGMSRVLAYYAEKDAAIIPRREGTTSIPVTRKNLLEQTRSLLPVTVFAFIALYLTNKYLV
jgi:hypothetical protein